MKIGIDARLIQETGVGRYIRNLISELSEIDRQNQYFIYLQPDDYVTFTPPNNRWTKRNFSAHWHTITEQFQAPLVFKKDSVDLLHIPYFNAPIFYSGKYIITIHDLTILHYPTGRATTLPPLLYFWRKLGYKLVLRQGIKRARHVLTVSESTKADIIKSFGTDSSKITVTYEGVDQRLISSIKYIKPRKLLAVSGKFFLYVGNAYPHKNVELLINAFLHMKKLIKGNVPLKLVLVGNIDYFYARLQKNLSQQAQRDIIFFGTASDSDLSYLYTHAVALVLPSISEGFGLPAIEALTLRLPVIASQLPVFKEILGQSAIYFNVNSPNSWRIKC
ncbi:hypothetical protein A2154_01575 [Candidatus Gottesmanbacteria bacterium RBG_16_43_7]|uniref:Glycosyl transferase family 1 domain-containing protein n=1 Tax=Candidatus Gottesmanbacteria bacterium RBG_16_43_7 TaxID=1798373 RepID=A0A1F5ZBP0_9BACT|nr:MAG: hypothetical protein A2154_01575 [Candidatus Gottesmanbacteria bacterium RBG_16_43_7]